MADNKKKILISGYIGFGNFGDEVIFERLSSFLKSKGIEVSVLSSKPKETARLYNVKAYKYKSIPDIIKAISSCDILFSGGGSLLQNRTSSKSLVYYATIIELAKMFGKRVVIFAQGLEGISGDTYKNYITRILKKCDLITVRDEMSKELLDSWGIESKLLCDPVYSLELPPYNPQGYVGIQLRKSSVMHPLFLENLSDGVIRYFKNRKIKIFSFEERMDDDICVEFANVLRRKQRNIDVAVIKNMSIPEVITEFSTLEYLISMRFHACVLGAMYGIKTMPIIYDNKVLNMAKKENLSYIDCSFSKDITNDFRSIENKHTPSKKNFNWEFFESIIQ